MKYFLKFLKLSIIISYNLIITSNANNLLIVDTFGNHEYAYKKFSILCNKAGFKTEFIQFYNTYEKNFLNYQAIFIITSTEFLQNQKNIIVKNLIKKLKEQTSNKIIGFILPNEVTKNSELELKVKVLLNKFKIINSKNNKKINLFLNLTKDLSYDTALYTKKENVDIKTIEQYQNFDISEGLFLPINKSSSDLVNKNQINGLFFKNPIKNNYIFISKMSLLFFSEIEEDFRWNPINIELRIQLINAIAQSLLEIKKISQDTSINDIKSSNLGTISDETQKCNQALKSLIFKTRNNYANEKLYSWTKNGIFAGWMDFDNLEPDTFEEKINNVINANLNFLWLRFNPEKYLSKRAIFSENKEKYFHKIKKFTKTLKDKYSVVNKPIPKIFIGIEITSNFKNHPVNESMKDIYAKDYTRIPCPLDIKNFWEIELFDVINKFIYEWKKSLGNELNIDGLFFDFEMYHAQDQASNFLAISDFSDCSWNLYNQGTNQNIKIKNVNKRIEYLYKNKKFDEYFKILQNQSDLLGSSIRNFIKSKLPNTILGIYMPTLPSSWFYLGILSGLSTKNEPLIIATFNNDFYSHYNWLTENNIYCYHMSVILLSKFRDIIDFNLIDYLNKQHDGIWFNRFSRLGDSYEKDKWYAIESSHLNKEIITSEIRKKSTLDNIQLNHNEVV